MFLKSVVVFLATLPSIVVSSPVKLKLGLQGYGDGGRYGFKKCADKGVRPGKVSCINFDTIKTNTTTAVGDIPKDYSGLAFSAQLSVLNVPASEDLGLLPEANKYSATSMPNALVGSRYNPKDKNDNSPASFGVENGTFDLFGFYLQPMASPPPGVIVYITGYPANEKKSLFEYNLSFLYSTREPYFVDLYQLTNKKWDELKNVSIWAGYGADEADWEFFVDDLWVRWGNETEAAIEWHNGELK